MSVTRFTDIGYSSTTSDCIYIIIDFANYHVDAVRCSPVVSVIVHELGIIEPQPRLGIN